MLQIHIDHTCIPLAHGIVYNVNVITSPPGIDFHIDHTYEVVPGAAAAADDACRAPDLHARLPLHQRTAVHRHRHGNAGAGGAALDLKEISEFKVQLRTPQAPTKRVAGRASNFPLQATLPKF